MFEHKPFGRTLKLSVSGASHGPHIRFMLENFPAGERIDLQEFAAFMRRRAPGQDALSTARNESDSVDFVQGLEDGLTQNGPIVGRIVNTDAQPYDYGLGRTIPRPGHADFGQWVELGCIPTGGGSNSGRLTAAYCAAGAICLQFLARRGIRVGAEIVQIGDRKAQLESAVRAVKVAGNSVGGVIRCTATGVPPGLGGALFAGLDSALSAALFAIPGVKGVSFGNGFAAAYLRGTENDDVFCIQNGGVYTVSNNHGGVMGGRTSGMPVVAEVAFKPTPTVFQPLASVDLSTLIPALCVSRGRHDPCIVRRAVPVVEAMTAFVLADLILATERAVPRICLTLTGRTLEEDLKQYRAERLFADMVELRADLLTPGERARAHAFPSMIAADGPLPRKIPVILTLRQTRDGGACRLTDVARRRFFKKALSKGDVPFAFVDFEHDFRCAELVALARSRGTRIIWSRHDFKGPIPNLSAVCRELSGAGDIAKIAYMPRNMSDVCAALRCGAETTAPHVVIAMGPLGRVTRAWSRLFGSLWTYASCGDLAELGHFTPQQLVRDERIRVLTPDFARYGVTGWPLTVTRSPELHNEAFAAADADAVLTALPAKNAREVVRLIRAFDLKGMAVTIPHKEAIIPFLDEVTPEARKIGAVNTIAVRDGRLIGYNTDFMGFRLAVLVFLGRADLAGLRVAVLGSGGAAKAVIWALKDLKAKYRVFHRTTPPQGFDLIVNATPVDPIPDYVFTGREAVFDLSYEPTRTPLLVRARAAGCFAEDGSIMLMEQARYQRQIWGY